ncbi:unnamed protein product [Lota lota]
MERYKERGNQRSMKRALTTRTYWCRNTVGERCQADRIILSFTHASMQAAMPCPSPPRADMLGWGSSTSH